MRQLITHDRTADGGYPLDSELHQMTDDGCPLIPDPARWADADWRDNLGESDTFEGAAKWKDISVVPKKEPSGSTVTQRARLLRRSDRDQPEAHSPAGLLRYARRAYPKCCSRVMGYFALLPPT